MTLQTFWEVAPGEIAALSDHEAVDVVRALPRRRSTSPRRAADLDAEVNVGNVQSGILFPGRTGYQIKTGTFNATGSGAAEKALLFKPSGLRKRSYGRGDLSPRIQALAEVNGTFVVILFGSGKPATSEENVKHKIREILRVINPALGFREIHIWRRHQISGIVNG